MAEPLHASRSGLDVVTGAFSFTGRAIAELLLARGRSVRSLSRRCPASAGSAPSAPSAPSSADTSFENDSQLRIDLAELQFHDLGALTDSLRGADTLYNTYWIRFPHGASTFERAVANTLTLLRAAEAAGVRRVVHVSVTNASCDSALPYFRGKAELEGAARDSPITHAIVRPTLVFGPNDILVNNIAWVMRRFPLFLVPGDGSYRVQPVSVEDVARLCVDAAPGAELDAAGPETYTFDELVRLIRSAVGGRARIVHSPAIVARGLAGIVGAARRDVMLTREETRGLMDSLLVSRAPATASDSFRAWVGGNADSLGRRYVSELARNYRHAPV